MERDNERRRMEELVEENMLLEIGQKQTRKSLVHELNECVSSRVLKLEKENRELQTSVETLKEEKHLLQEQQLHTQELGRENQGFSNKIERLQGLLEQERLTNQDMESLGEEILKEKLNVEREVHTLRAEKDRQISELESEKQHLSDAVASLQERAQSNSEARRPNSNWPMRRQRGWGAGRGCEELERETARLERGRDTLSRELASLRVCSEQSEALEKQVSSLEQEVHRLKRELEEAQGEQQRLGRRAEHSLLSKENLDLRCSMENLRSSSTRLASLQDEHKEVQGQTQDLQRKLKEARGEAQERRRGQRGWSRTWPL
ncbi:hypothetical protein KUCAC02_025566 [Chaenocephalus aceratus]|uniref:Uncharacterized protein n=1 Tax=Chaenocephalus aceratus TaxID=36190 RepID=A0ACB9VVF6_CHAAC|nr:hypothetical protein KUCAC02_025566 [Chaenocephalus aceratus]